MPKNVINNKKKANSCKKNKSSSEDVSTSYDSQSETVDSTSDETTAEYVPSSSSFDEIISEDDETVSENAADSAADDNDLASQDDISESEEPVRIKLKKTGTIKSKKTVPVKSKGSSYMSLRSMEKNGKDTKKICFEKINEQFSIRSCGDFPVIIADQNGYVNATKLCQEIAKKNGSKKVLKEFFKTDRNKKIVKSVSLYTNINVKDLTFIIKTSINKIRGTYVHSLLMIHIGMWLGSNFAVEISKWIEEWKLYSPKNEIRFQKALTNIESDHNSLRERNIQKILHRKFGGEIEVKIDAGFIDLLTEKYLIEIKCYDNWKAAAGQLRVYSLRYPDRKKMMYLFDVPKNNILDVILEYCAEDDICLRIHHDE